MLLDKTNPSRVLSRSCEPLIRPTPSAREGYVPNAVYTCGLMRHHDRIILPCAVSDTFTTFATVEIKTLLRSMVCRSHQPLPSDGQPRRAHRPTRLLRLC